jgi:hypothetical protein
LTPTHEHYDDKIFDHNPTYGDIEVTPETGDTFLGAEILLPRGGVMTKARVTSRKRDMDGNLKGTANNNPILDTREYVVTFDDGDVTDLTASMIAASMYAQCDPDGNQYVLLDSIIDYHRDDMALQPADQIVTRPDGRTYKRCNTIGWELCCQ